MNSIKVKMTCQTSLDDLQDDLENFQQTSPEMKKLMEFLQSHPASDFADKLRSQVYIPKNTIGAKKNEPLKKLISPNKTAILLSSNNKNQQKQVHFANKIVSKERKGFFSPKTGKKSKENNETPNPNFVSLQLSKQYLKTLKKPFSFLNKQTKISKQIFQSQKEIPYRNTVSECPDFLKKGLKTAKSLDIEAKLSIEDFAIFKTLGQGTFGQVFAAIHKQSGFICTMKRYKKEIIKSHELQNKFINDIKVQMKMSHPHIVKLYGFFDDIVYFYMVFEYMESGSLVKTIDQKGGQLPQNEIFRKVFEINDALLYLHEQNIIHRDIKPASVLTCLNVCKLCDTEWIQQNSNNPQHITLCKELDYMPPEAIQGKQITNEFDIWGLGLIAFELLKGKRMIQGSNQKILIRKIISLKKELIQIMLPKQCSQNLKSFILSTLEPISSKRIKSCEINKMKIQKQKEAMKISLVSKNFSTHERIISFSQKLIPSEPRGSPKQISMFGVKKQIKNQFSTIL